MDKKTVFDTFVNLVYSLAGKLQQFSGSFGTIR